jgi:hypothetical protein
MSYSQLRAIFKVLSYLGRQAGHDPHFVSAGWLDILRELEKRQPCHDGCALCEIVQVVEVRWRFLLVLALRCAGR